jgi:hypothetical protein
MDKATRNTIERATQQARTLLDEDFSSQLEGTFDVLRSGVIASKGGAHLSELQQSQRDKIVAAIEHKRSAGMTAAEAVTDYVRDSAFTTLNRFVALKMLEARELVQQCITKGEQSAGYREFCGMAPGVALLPDAAGYRLYLESVFDELSTEVKVLFDRRDAPSQLWPRRQAFDTLLETLNGGDLAQVWLEDETLGWVYQYFNSREERRDMREESQAPRDSRELAIRNQFFTPRYVIEFLVDNTLGRQWVEMTEGQTALTSECAYLLPATDGIWPARDRKDPREIRVVDPACGSGHFLLYAFDLLAKIYEEAWSISGFAASDGTTLNDTFATRADLVAAIPALILRHNLFGIDVDPRCAQIAQLALWMRGQSWLTRNRVPREKRAPIARTNIVVSEPMPGEADLLQAFTATLEPKPLAELFSAICERLHLAADLGVLLRIEADLRGLIATIEAATKQGTLFDVDSSLPTAFWQQAERALVRQLSTYAQIAAGAAGTRRRLFADDAAHGVALVDLLQLRFDVALMNPPFGKGSVRGKDYFDSQYSHFKTDIGVAFVHRMLELLAPGGLVGALTSRNFLAVDTFKWFRQNVLLAKAPPSVMLDLGYGVLDGALVEAAAYVLEPGRTKSSTFVRVLDSRDKELAAREHFVSHQPRRDLTVSVHSIEDFASVPLQVICYWLPKSVLTKITSLPPLSESGAAARHGLQTTDDFRFLRLRWEVETGTENRWVPIAKGGEYKPFWEDLTLTVDWGDDGKQLKTYLAEKRLRLQGSADWTPWLNHSEFYFAEGLTYPERTTSDFSPRVLPTGAAFSGTGIAIQFATRSRALAYLAGAYTRVFKMVTESLVGSGDNAFSGSAAKRYRSGLLNQIPAPLDTIDNRLCDLTRESISVFWHIASLDETASTFSGTDTGQTTSLNAAISGMMRWKLRSFARVLDDNLSIEEAVRTYYSFEPADTVVLDDLVGPHPNSYPNLSSERENEARSLYSLESESVMARVISEIGARRQLTKKSFIADRKLELIAHLMRASASSIARALAESVQPSSQDMERGAIDELSYAIGVAFGRWLPEARPTLERVLCEEELFAPPVSRARAPRNGIARILVDDEGHTNDLVGAVRAALRERWGNQGDAIYSEIETVLCVDGGDLRTWLSKKFFDLHLRQYQDARRKAPVYLQVGCPSSRYSVWLYYPTMNQDTLFAVLQDCVIPKVAHEARRLAELRGESGGGARQRRLVQVQEDFISELNGFADDLKIAATLWRPSADDGTVVACAPLWKLFGGHRGWQSECSEAWKSLQTGEFDWATTGMRLWPERVIAKCATDRSLAIAHGLEGSSPGDSARSNAIESPTRAVASAAVASALQTLLGSDTLRHGRRRRVTQQ